MKQIVIRYGIISGLVLALVIFLSAPLAGDKMDFSKGEKLGFISMLVALSMVFFAIRHYRDKKLNGSITFNQAFRVGILVTLIASFFYVISWMIFIKFVDTSFMDKYHAYYVAEMQASGKSAAEIQKADEEFKKIMTEYRKPWVMALYTMVEIFPVGLVVTLICAVLMKKNPQSTGEVTD